MFVYSSSNYSGFLSPTAGSSLDRLGWMSASLHRTYVNGQRTAKLANSLVAAAVAAAGRGRALHEVTADLAGARLLGHRSDEANDSGEEGE
jgi:hypothetical protein